MNIKIVETENRVRVGRKVVMQVIINFQQKQNKNNKVSKKQVKNYI